VFKWSIRDLWGKLTQKKELKPEMREMLLGLDGVYEQRPDEPRSGPDGDPASDGEPSPERS
jgi:hypothetical protein